MFDINHDNVGYSHLSLPLHVQYCMNAIVLLSESHLSHHMTKAVSRGFRNLDTCRSKHTKLASRRFIYLPLNRRLLAIHHAQYIEISELTTTI
jgi:hypothetical protein